MAVWSEVKHSTVLQAERIDAEYFMPHHIDIVTRVSALQHKSLGDLGTVVCSAFYPAATDLYEIGNTPFIRCVDVINFPLMTPGQEYVQIPKEFVDENSSIRCAFPGDIVITKVGTPCYAGLLDATMPEVALSRTVLALKDINTSKVDPRYLVLFLRSKYGFDQLMRERELTIQYQLTLDRTRNVKIYMPSLSKQRRIGDYLSKHLQKKQESEELYKQVENLLLDELGLADLDLSDELFYERNYSEVEGAKRIDADYYQPKYLDLLDKLSSLGNKYSVKPISSLSSRLKYGTSDKLSYVESGSPFLRIADIRNNTFDADTVLRIPHDEAAQQRSARVRTGDVIISRSGTLGLAVAIQPEFDNAVFGSYFIRISPDNNEVNSDYLALYLNLLPGELQVSRSNTGGIQTNLTIPAIEGIQVVYGNLAWQERIADIVNKSFKSLKESKQLLQQAVQMVEDAILNGEK